MTMTMTMMSVTGREKVRYRIPQRPAREPPRKSREEIGAGLEASEHVPNLGRVWSVLLGMALAVAVILGLQALVQSEERELQALDDNLFTAFSVEHRRRALEELPSASEELELLAKQTAEATVTLQLNGETIRLQSAVGAQPASKHFPAQLSHRHVLIGLPSADKLALLQDLEHFPGHLVPCAFAHQQQTWASDGGCILFEKDQLTENIEKRLILVAQKHRQPALVKWWPHIWGTKQDQHYTIMQSVIPSSAKTNMLKSHHPVYLVGADLK
eukprot:CAMPEP_0184520914 /NCGR_PEP_ID=MMETSP0198_2-20121128/7431_1 /TAXON_ID=1112570 /ORGANISM="Thraustochytrium sp., Strain LLF1b" /LENGTH=270 /DNA_ID=CAMNT_0026911563 /DNA_START=13 /DNA_END=825 /DNA_ORIENTATION=-